MTYQPRCIRTDPRRLVALSWLFVLSFGAVLAFSFAAHTAFAQAYYYCWSNGQQSGSCPSQTPCETYKCALQPNVMDCRLGGVGDCCAYNNNASCGTMYNCNNVSTNHPCPDYYYDCWNC